MREAVIVATARTPLGKRGGLLSGVRPDEMGAIVLNAVVERAGIRPEMVEDVVMGCVTQIGEQGANIGRLSVLLAGWPETVPAVSINRMCGSSQQAVHFIATAIMSGAMEIGIAAGVESMSRVVPASDGAPLHPNILERFPIDTQFTGADMIAKKWGISRREMDEYSHQSHLRASAATRAGYFKGEMVPMGVTAPDGRQVHMDFDEGIRHEPDLEKMLALKSPFGEDCLITAGNASQVTDGAAAVLLMSREKALELGLKPRARIVAMAVVGSDPVMMLTGPIPATKMVLDRAGLTLDDMDAIEINEAFASVVLAWAREYEPDMSKVNPVGGAIALGHPVGCSGARLMGTLLHHLERTGGRYGLQTMCIGHGMGIATIIERLD